MAMKMVAACRSAFVAMALLATAVPTMLHASAEASSSTNPLASTSDETQGFYGPGQFFTREGFRAQFTAKDFTFDLEGSTPAASGDGGWLRSLSAADLPALAGEGVAMVLIELEPCGINIPHVHPRATELQYVISAPEEGINVEFIEENTGRRISNTVYTGDAAFFPQGLTHVESNNGCSTARLLSSFGHDDFGVQTLSSQALTKLDTATLAASLNIDVDTLAGIIDAFPANPSAGTETCRQKCNI